MLTVILGLAAAVCWGGSTICSTRTAKLIGAGSAVAWVMIVGLVVTLPVVVVVGLPAAVDGPRLAALVASGALTALGLTLDYAGLRAGQVALVAPIVSTEGAIAALIAVATGEALGGASFAALAVVVLGVVLASAGGGHESDGGRDATRRSIGFAIAAALAFGVSLYAAGDLGKSVGPLFVVFVARVVGVAVSAAPLALRRRLALTRQTVWLVIVAGLGEVGGYLTFVAGARHGVAVTAVVASQFATVAALGGVVVYGERLGRTQLLGVIATLVGVATLSALHG